MKELLEELKKLEPERAILLEGWEGDYVSAVKEAIIQAEIQKAIEAKGWQYEQRWYGTEKIVLVYPPGITWLIRHESDNYAESLIRAYLEALETVRKNEAIA